MDMWRVLIYTFLPVALVAGTLFLQQGMPKTYRTAAEVAPLEAGAMGITECSPSRDRADPAGEDVGPLDGSVGQKLVNVLEVNLEIRARCGLPAR